MPADEGEQPAEHIPDEDQASRAYLEVLGQSAEAALAPETQFPFTYDRKRDERAESFYWRRYAPSVADIHTRGCALQALLNRRRQDRGRAVRYVGARTTSVAAIRSISSRGHRLIVFQYVEFGDRAHAHVAIEPAHGTKVENVKKNDRLALALLLGQVLGDLESHTCAE